MIIKAFEYLNRIRKKIEKLNRQCFEMKQKYNFIGIFKPVCAQMP